MNPKLFAASCVAPLAFLFVFAGAVSAQTVVYNNLVSSGNSVQNWSGLFKVGQSFTPTASGTIFSVTLNLTMSSTATPVYSVELWSDSGGATPLPSTLLATFVSNKPWSSLYTGSSGTYNASNTVTFSEGSFGQNYSVLTGTPYWLVVTSTSGTAKAWGIGSVTGNSSAGFSSTTGTWSSLSLSGDLGAQISVNGTPAIPEPGTYAAFAGLMALAVAGCTRRRRCALVRHS